MGEYEALSYFRWGSFKTNVQVAFQFSGLQPCGRSIVQVRSPKLRIIAEKENSREDETSEIKAKWINRAGTDKSNLSHGGI